MENFLPPRTDIQKTYTYEELCQEVSLVLGIKLPTSLEEFLIFDNKYIIDICGKYIMDKDSKKSALVSYIMKLFHEHKVMPSNNKDISGNRRPPLPWSYSGYYYEIKRVLKVNIPTPPHKKKFTKALFQELLGPFQKEEGLYESIIAHHGKFFVSDYIGEELKSILQEKKLLQGRNNKSKKHFTNKVVGFQESDIQEHNHTNGGDNTIVSESNITNQSHNIYVSESDLKLIQGFLKIISSRSTSSTNTTFLEAVVSILQDSLGHNSYWKEQLVVYMTHGELDLQKIKKTFERTAYKESKIYKYIVSFQSNEQKNT